MRAKAARTMRLWLAAFACCFLGLAASQAAAMPEEIKSDTSSHEVSIETDFSGIRVVVFGAVDNSRQTDENSGFYDVVIVLRGPNESVVARHKERIAGLWVNADAIVFHNAPSFYAVLSTRPLDQIASPEILHKYGLGFDSLDLQPDSESASEPPETIAAYRRAVIDLKEKAHLYRQDPYKVTFVGRSLFRGTIELPSNVPVGLYTSHVYLFRHGNLLSSDETKVLIDKAGIGQFTYYNAFNRPLLYGIAAVLIAIAAGLAGSMLFRSR